MATAPRRLPHLQHEWCGSEKEKNILQWQVDGCPVSQKFRPLLVGTSSADRHTKRNHCPSSLSFQAAAAEPPPTHSHTHKERQKKRGHSHKQTHSRVASWPQYLLWTNQSLLLVLRPLPHAGTHHRCVCVCFFSHVSHFLVRPVTPSSPVKVSQSLQGISGVYMYGCIELRDA